MQSTNNTNSQPNTFVFQHPKEHINALLGVPLDNEYRNIGLNGKGSDTYLTADKKLENAKDQATQMSIVEKLINILKSCAPLCPLNQRGLFEINSEEEMYDDGGNANCGSIVHFSNDTTPAKAALIASVFYERIKPYVVDDAFQEFYLRGQLAVALDWHLEKNLKGDIEKVHVEDSVRIETKEKKHEPKLRRTSSPTTSGRSEIKPPVKTEPVDVKKRKNSNSGNLLHLSLSNLQNISSSASVSPKRGESKLSPSQRLMSEKDALREAMLRRLSLDSLYNCRRRWIDVYNKHGFTSNELEWDDEDHLLVENFKILDNPMMHQLLQCELSKDIAFTLDPHILMQDIHRNLDYIDKDHHSRTKAYLKENILEIKNQDSKIDEEKARFDAEVTCFYYILKRILSEIGQKKEKEQEAILSMWKDCSKAELNSDAFNNEAFVRAGEKFFRELRRNDDPFSQKVVSLLTLLRQKNYIHPFNLIHEVTSDISLSYHFDDPQRLMRFDFKDGKVEFSTSLKASPSKEATKWKDGVIKCSGFEIEILNIMRSESSDLKSWRSIIKINVVVNDFKSKKQPLIKQLIIEPLKSLGFNVDVKSVESSFSRSF